jgi:ADP-ribose pyrophosphatase
MTELLKTSRFTVEKVDFPGDPDRAVIRHPGAVVLLPTLDNGQVCLIRNFRVSVQRSLLELPAGTLEPGEAPELTASRELAEETGYRAGNLALLRTFYPAPGILDEKMYLFHATHLIEGPPAREAGEQIENVIVDFDQALAWVDDGTIVDGKTIIGLLLRAREERR